MKTVKINFTNFWGSFKKDKNLFTEMLSRHFKVEISEDPDILICSNRGDPFDYMRYDCPRLMLVGEPFSADFTAFDYVIGHDYITFGDRYFRMPYGLYFDSAKPWKPESLTKEQAEELLGQKKYFCNFIYSHPSAGEVREKMFEALSSYKYVESPGKLLNNTQPGQTYKRISWDEKNDYLRFSKFTIAAENTAYDGYVTEKIVQPFQHHSIPVYYGDPLIYKDFNKDAFIYMPSADGIGKMLSEVEYLDTHDGAYIEMLTQCPLVKPGYVEEVYAALEEFLVNIFSQDREDAYRRPRYFCAHEYEENLKQCRKIFAVKKRVSGILKR